MQQRAEPNILTQQPAAHASGVTGSEPAPLVAHHWLNFIVVGNDREVTLGKS